MEKNTGPKTRPTIRMVAELAGVSTATVSYVLSGRRGDIGPGVSDPTAEKVRAVARQLGYRPNQAARTIRMGKTNTVILSLTMLSDPWAQSVIRAVQQAAKPMGITPMILGDANWVEILDVHSADAVFVDGVSAGQSSEPGRLAERGMKLVVFDEHLDPEGFDVIRSVARPGCEIAMAHLLEGHSKIGCLTRAVDSSGWNRYTAYATALTEAGLPIRDEYVEFFDGSETGAYLAATRILSLADRPTAIYATSDYIALSAISAAQRLGLEVGKDVDILGVGNSDLDERLEPSLTTVGPADFFDRVARLLLDRAVNSAPAKEPGLTEFPWKLFVRNSAPRRTSLTRLS